MRGWLGRLVGKVLAMDPKGDFSEGSFTHTLTLTPYRQGRWDYRPFIEPEPNLEAERWE